MKKRAIVLFGAGASVEYKVPSTTTLTEDIERSVMADGWMKHSGGDAAYATIRNKLKDYLCNPGVVHFEHIYHCAHELLSRSEPGTRAFDEFRPLLVPFLDDNSGIPETALLGLVRYMAKVIYAKISAACGRIPPSLDPLRAFFDQLKSQHVLRIYTTNYDDIPLQADSGLYTGFAAAPRAGPKAFEVDTFWQRQNANSIFHLHGSVHLGFPHPIPPGADIGELFWFDDRAEALKHSSFNGGVVRRMDGSSFLPTAVITGLDKLSRLQQRPLSHFYSAMAVDLMAADVIYVIGSGLADLHLTTWLQEARSRTPRPPLLFVDYWSPSFLEVVEFYHDRKDIEMFHALKMHVGGHYGGARIGTGWTLSSDDTCAVWDKGFKSFLSAASDHDQVIAQLRSRR